MGIDTNAAASQNPAMNNYEQLAHLLAEPEPTRRSSLGELDYRPGHGQPGGNRIEREPSEPDADPARFDYPGPPRRPWRSGTLDA